MQLTAIQEKLKTIPEEYMTEVYNYLDFLQYKILYKKQNEGSKKKDSKSPSRHFKTKRILYVSTF